VAMATVSAARSRRRSSACCARPTPSCFNAYELLYVANARRARWPSRATARPCRAQRSGRGRRRLGAAQDDAREHARGRLHLRARLRGSFAHTRARSAAARSSCGSQVD
jgi:hypothetical protein